MSTCVETASGLGERIRFARERAGMTQAELARQIGLADAQSVSNYERGRSEVPRERLRRISAATRTPIAYFVSEPEVAEEETPLLERIAAGIAELSHSQELTFALLAEIRERLERLEGP